jgi:hypothetical protein
MDIENDEEFIQAFEDCTIPPEDFNHQSHIRMAWIYLRTKSDAAEHVISGIQKYATACGLSNLYHDTITRFWIAAVEKAIEADPQTKTFPAFLERNIHLSDSHFIDQFYTRELLFSDAARASWVEPDLLLAL